MRRKVSISDRVLNIEHLGAFLTEGSAYLVARINTDKTEVGIEVCNNGLLNYRLQEYFDGKNVISHLSVYKIYPTRQNRLHRYLVWMSPPKLRRRHRENQRQNA